MLERYPMQLEVCTVTYSRTWGGFVGRDEAEAHGSLTASWSPEGPNPDRYRAVSVTSTRPGSLVLDQEAINELRPVPVDVSTPGPIEVDQIVSELKAGPVTMGGPGEGWVVQGLANTSAGYVHLEILDPVHWGSGPALPAEQLAIAKELGFEPAEGMWILHVPGTSEEDLRRAAEVLQTYMQRAWHG